MVVQSVEVCTRDACIVIELSRKVSNRKERETCHIYKTSGPDIDITEDVLWTSLNSCVLLCLVDQKRRDPHVLNLIKPVEFWFGFYVLRTRSRI